MEQATSQIDETIPNKRRLFIKRSATRTTPPSFLKFSYETVPIHENIKNEDEKNSLLELTNNVLVSCNLNYYVYFIVEI